MLSPSSPYVIVAVALGACILLFPVAIPVLLAPCAVLAALRFSMAPVSRGVVGFFHPHAEDGGGGERVLWCAVKALQSSRSDWRVAVFTSDGHDARELIERAKHNFNLDVTSDVKVIPLLRVHRLDSAAYPQFTLFRQALASVFVAWEGLRQCVPEVFVDTTGWPFVYPLARLAGSRVVCYVHYPTISTDMFERVRTRTALYNNSEAIGNSAVLSDAKLAYYRLFAAMYGIVGRFPSAVLVNSTWTMRHVRSLWKTGRTPVIVYPPVDTDALQKIPLKRPAGASILISVGQFRPEKNHQLQLEAFAVARRRALERQSVESDRATPWKLHVVGSCRNEGDRQRLRDLKDLSGELGIEEAVEFFENVPFDRLVELLGNAVAGLHTMLDEHFGIGIVEFMAAGVIPIAHDSGGPKTDILSPGEQGSCRAIGYLQSTVVGYANAIAKVMEMDDSERLNMAQRCRQRSQTFSQERFAEGFMKVTDTVLNGRRGEQAFPYAQTFRVRAWRK